jgi:hypothetical protein
MSLPPGFGIVSSKKPEMPRTRFTAGSAILLVIAEFIGLSHKLHLCMRIKYAARGYRRLSQSVVIPPTIFPWAKVPTTKSLGNRKDKL